MIALVEGNSSWQYCYIWKIMGYSLTNIWFSGQYLIKYFHSADNGWSRPATAEVRLFLFLLLKLHSKVVTAIYCCDNFTSKHQYNTDLFPPIANIHFHHNLSFSEIHIAGLINDKSSYMRYMLCVYCLGEARHPACSWGWGAPDVRP